MNVTWIERECDDCGAPIRFRRQAAEFPRLCIKCSSNTTTLVSIAHILKDLLLVKRAASR